MITSDIQALTAHFVAQWASVSTTVPVFYDNQPNAVTPTKAPWVRFSVRMGASIHHAGSATSGVKKQQGRVWLQVFVPNQTGSGVMNTLVDGFMGIFENKRLDSSKIHMGTLQPSEPRDGGDGFTMMAVSVPFDSYRAY